MGYDSEDAARQKPGTRRTRTPGTGKNMGCRVWAQEVL
jgi:hypothetical protein